MTAQFWTTNGSDIWRMRRVFEFRNLETDEVVTADNVTDVMDKKFTPVTMPEIKTKVESSSRGRRSKSKYKGVNKAPNGKYRVQFYDKVKKKTENLGTFDSELLAAAAYQERAGNTKEAKRLRNEYEEGNCRPDDAKEVHKEIFPSEE